MIKRTSRLVTTDVFKPSERDNDGFIKLIKREYPLPIGTQLLIGSDSSDIFIRYNITPFLNRLNIYFDQVKKGKYPKPDKEDQEMIDEFAKVFKWADLSMFSKLMLETARKLIVIGKSYYEYSSKEFIDNISYDGLLAKYLKTGATEPTGIIPKGSKFLQKTKITYSKLHNNMDKAYAIRITDPIPEGVKESDTLENFLIRVYSTLGLSGESPMSLMVAPKIDGVSINGTIKGKKLTKVQTRGDQEESVSVMGLNGISIGKVEALNKFGIQYEAFVTEPNRIKASEYLGLDRPYVSCRHAAAGITHRLSTMEDPELIKFLSFYPIETEGLDNMSYKNRMSYIENFGRVPSDMITRKIITGNLKSLLEQITNLFHHFTKIRETISYAIDGMVITVLDDDYQESLGREGRTNKYQLGLKFDPATAITTVRGISLDSGKKGYRTIQVELEHPVFLDGVRYDHVPVLSANLYKEIPLRVGSKVSIHRVGDVIPAISLIKEGSGTPLRLPKVCPTCGKELQIRNKKLYCDNPECKDNIAGIFTHFFEEMGLVGYSDSFAELLVEKCKCKSIADVIQLTPASFERAECATAVTLKFPDLLKKAISNHTDYEILGAMGLPGVGVQKAKILLKNCKLSEYVNPLSSHGPMDDIVYNACVAAVGRDQAPFLNYTINGRLFKESWLMISKMITKVTTNWDKKPRVGYTGGKLMPDTIQIINKNGFEITEGRSFDILITSSMDRTSTKMDVAKKKNIPIFLERDFCKQYKRS